MTTLTETPDSITGSEHKTPEKPNDPRIGRILTVRHGQPDVSDRTGPAISGSQYVDWWAEYERASLVPGQSPGDDLIARADGAAFLFASPRPRALQTARLLAGDRCVRTDDVFVECPLPLPDLPDLIRLSPRSWGIVARSIWMLGYSGGQETTQEARLRARRAAHLLVQTARSGDDVVLVAHGWFNRVLHRHIVKAGWKRSGLPKPGIFPVCNAYWGHRLYEYADTATFHER